jgi:alpha-glucosidase
MQTYFLRKLRAGLWLVAVPSLLVGMVFSTSGYAQTLAKPGWVGSGMAAEPWWKNAVLYRISVRSFQDSNGDGVGDLSGVADRMDYLQSLGVDAIVLEQMGDGEGFDDIITAATPRHIRVLVTMEDGASPEADLQVVAQSRMWLTRGAAGVFLHSTQSAANAAPLLHRLRSMTDSFPGGRVLLAETSTNPAPSSIHAISLDEQPTAAKSTRAVAAEAQLMNVPLELTNATAVTIRASLNGVNSAPAATSLFLTEEMYSTGNLLDPEKLAALEGRRRMYGLILLATRSAAELRYGQEIGLLPMRSRGINGGPDALMQWTATNITPVEKPAEKPVEKPAEAPVAKAEPVPSDGYGTYHPYVAPPKVRPAPGLADAEPSGAAAAVDPESLKGFTTGTLPAMPAGSVVLDKADTNVAHEDADPNSLLNFYRRLIALHHSNPALRNGTETLLDYDGLDAVVWFRKPPAGSTALPIVVVCNLSGNPLSVSLSPDLLEQHLKPGSMRSLLTTGTADSVQSTDHFSLPAYGVFMGELYR